MNKISNLVVRSLLIGTGSLLSLILLRKYANGPKTKRTKRMDGKVVIVTGPSAGIGKVTALELLSQGATVVFAARDLKKTSAILDSINDQNIKKNAHLIRLDLSDFSSIREFSEKFKQQFNQLDILINNAGAWNTQFSLTKDGIENTIGSNHIGPMVLTNYLLDQIQKSNGRIINVSSRAHKRVSINFNNLKELIVKGIPENYDFNKDKYASFSVYSESKLANIYFTNYLADYFMKNNIDVKVVSLHPGVVLSDFFRSTYKIIQFLAMPLAYLLMKSSFYGAQTTLELCYIDDKDIVNGGYYDDCRIAKLSNDAEDIEKRNIYMQYSRLIIQTFGKGNNIELKY